jgi:Rrf2 family protein
MLDLALRRTGGSVTLKDISHRQEVSARYLENLLAPLRANGLVRTERGNKGGYILGREPSKISLGEIARVLDGTLAPVPCVDDPQVCHRATRCVTRRIWCKLHEGMVNCLYGISLADMVAMQEELASPNEGETKNNEKCLE